MIRLFRFVRPQEDFVVIKVPSDMKGKLVEIIIAEKAPDKDTVINAEDTLMMETKEDELKVMDKIRNQINFWDM